MTNRSGGKESNRVHIRCSINGEPARVLLELKHQGIIRSNADAVCQGLLALWEKVVKRELEEAQLKASKRLDEE
jgi:hypothetical protein